MTLDDWIKLDFRDNLIRGAFADWCEEKGLIEQVQDCPNLWQIKLHGGYGCNKQKTRFKCCKALRFVYRHHVRRQKKQYEAQF